MLSKTDFLFKFWRDRFVTKANRIEVVSFPLLNQCFDVSSDLAGNRNDFLSIPKVDAVIENGDGLPSRKSLQSAGSFVADDGANIMLVTILPL